MSSPAISGTARVTVRVNNGSPVSMRSDATVKFAAPRSSASRVTPRLSSRDLIVMGSVSAGAAERGLCSCSRFQNEPRCARFDCAAKFFWPQHRLRVGRKALDQIRHLIARRIHNSQVFEFWLRGVQCCRWKIYSHQSRCRNIEHLRLTPFVWLKRQKGCRTEQRNTRGEAAEFTMSVELWLWLHYFCPLQRGTADTETKRRWR